MTSLVILIRILVSAVLSGLIGLEREFHGCAAGLRTHILVCIGSTLFMLTSINIASAYGDLGGVDPSRIAAGVVTGIGFLGAGAIIRYGVSIRGLTTAASIWAVAAIGLAVGAGQYNAAGITTFVGLTVLVLSRLEERMALKKPAKILKIKLEYDTNTNGDDIKNIISAYGGRIRQLSFKEDKEKKYRILSFDLMLSRMHLKDIVTEVAYLPGVENVKWE